MKVFKLEQQVKELKKGNNAGKAKAHKTTPADAETDHIGLYARKFAVMNEHTLLHAALLVR